jgi:hypothetical protein
MALFVCYVLANCLEWSESCFSFVIYHPTAWSGAYPKFIIYHPTPIDSTCFFFYYIASNSDRSDLCFSFVIYISTAYWSGAYPKFIISSSADRRAFSITIYIIQRRSERLALFVCYISINCLYWSGEYPKFNIYHPTPIGAIRAFRLLCIHQLPIASRFLFVIYQSTAYCMEWSVPKIYYISSNADRLDLLFLLLYIIQRRLERLALFVCNIPINCLYCSGEYLKFIIYHPTPIDSTCFSFFIYQSSAYCMEWSVPKIYYISSNADRLELFLLLFIITIGATRAFCL